MTFQPFITKPKRVSKAKLYMMHVIHGGEKCKCIGVEGISKENLFQKK